MGHTEPTPAQVDFLLSLLVGLVEQAEGLGQAKAFSAIAEQNPESVSPLLAAKYSLMREDLRGGTLTNWERIRDWMGRHLPAGTNGCDNPSHAHE